MPAEVTSLDTRARIILEAVDDEIAEHFVATGTFPSWKELGMSLNEYSTFLFSPMKWARSYVQELHGEKENP